MSGIRIQYVLRRILVPLQDRLDGLCVEAVNQGLDKGHLLPDTTQPELGLGVD